MPDIHGGDRHGVWDTHVHLLDPEEYPYTDHRSYTPAPALPQDLLQRSQVDNFLVVQASVEDGCAGLLTQLHQLKQQHPDRVFRAEVVYEESWQDEQIHVLHQAGVRCLRIRSPSGRDPEAMAREVEQLLSGRPGQMAKQQHWAIALQLPLQVWVKIAPVLEALFSTGTKVIVEHIASITVPLSPADTIAFDALVGLLRRQKNLYVKLGALHRRIDRSRGGTMEQLRVCVRTIADAAGPGNLLWGSDWPHVDSKPRGGRVEAPHLDIDEREELGVLREWLTHEQVEGMLIKTPPKLFGA